MPALRLSILVMTAVTLAACSSGTDQSASSEAATEDADPKGPFQVVIRGEKFGWDRESASGERPTVEVLTEAWCKSVSDEERPLEFDYGNRTLNPFRPYETPPLSAAGGGYANTSTTLTIESCRFSEGESATVRVELRAYQDDTYIEGSRGTTDGAVVYIYTAAPRTPNAGQVEVASGENRIEIDSSQLGQFYFSYTTELINLSR